MSLQAKELIKSCNISRIQSSSSINTYRQCPRKYYYSYIRRLPQKPSIHLIRGKIAHEVVEDFFKINIDSLTDNCFEFNFKIIVQDRLLNLWNEAKQDLAALDMGSSELNNYFEETKNMLFYWLEDFIRQLKNKSVSSGLKRAFMELRPVSEEHFISKDIGVQGYVDAIHKDEKGIRLIDYKTSKKDCITDDYRLQLAIYSLLYHEKYGEYPYKAGVYLFRHGERLIDVDEYLLDFARKELQRIHINTSSENINDFPKKPSILCNWGKGCCDFYNQCCLE
ncbi:MAG: RecB family exonuclease [Nanobdellota archaeon]